tara:strand:+ start:155 stop:592 length:438 start_codon:yes stop_codon:yes gene_type:complete
LSELKKSKLKIYIAGPMSGHEDLNWSSFDKKERELIDAGWTVVNPAKMDREMGLNPTQLGEYDYEDAARRDIEALKKCDAIYLMSGFQFSKGACWERALARHWGLKRYYEIPRHDHEIENYNEYESTYLRDANSEKRIIDEYFRP